MTVKREQISKVFWAFLLVCSLLQAKGQYINALYNDNHGYMLFGSVEVKDSALYITGVTDSKQTPFNRKGLFAKLGFSGNQEFMKEVSSSDTSEYEIFTNCLKPTADGNFVSVGRVVDTTCRTFLMKVDTGGNILLWKEYSNNQTNIYSGQDVCEIPGLGYLLSINANYLNNNSSVIILSVDFSGSLLSQNRYDLSSEEWPTVITPKYNGNFLIGAFSCKANTNTPFWSKTWVLEVDSLGVLVNQWIDSSNLNLAPLSMKQTIDSGLIIARQHLSYDLNDYQAFNASIIKLDKNFNKEWEVVTGGIAADAGLYDIELLPTGDFIMCGANPILNTPDSSHIYGWVLKLSDSGQVLWERNFLPSNWEDTWAYLYDIELLSNGDIIGVGQKKGIDPPPYQQGWVIYLDSSGCLSADCDSMTAINFDGLSQERIEVTVYPNPAFEVVTVDYGFTNWSKGDVELQIVNSIGQTVYEQQVPSFSAFQKIDVSHFASGIYLATIKRQGQIIANAKFVKE
ncbi:MAG: T9SS type A sorting domain-containing protein [Chitinophagales bacterium]